MAISALTLFQLFFRASPSLPEPLVIVAVWPASGRFLAPGARLLNALHYPAWFFSFCRMRRPIVRNLLATSICPDSNFARRRTAVFDPQRLLAQTAYGTYKRATTPTAALRRSLWDFGNGATPRAGTRPARSILWGNAANGSIGVAGRVPALQILFRICSQPWPFRCTTVLSE